MAERRIVCEHPDGRRISCLESDFNRADGNPYNKAATQHDFDANKGTTILRQLPERPMDDWQSLKDEGFEPVRAIDPETGNECPLEA